jgi:hypothetical protein
MRGFIWSKQLNFNQMLRRFMPAGRKKKMSVLNILLLVAVGWCAWKNRQKIQDFAKSTFGKKEGTA